MVNETLEELEIICADKGIRIVGNSTHDEYLVGNQKRIREALMNILSNAVKYIGASEPKEISVSLQHDKKALRLTVSDTGIGIAPEELPHIFDRFYRVKHSRSTSTGTGLGLAIAKSIIEQHGGTIEVSSTLGKGTTFTIGLSTPL